MKGSLGPPRLIAAVELAILLIGLYLSWIAGRDEVERQAVNRGYAAYERGPAGKTFIWLENRR